MSTDRIRMAQFGTKHGHAAGWASVMMANPDVELVGVHEPDGAQMETLRASGEHPWSDVTWLEASDILDDRSIVAVASEGQNSESLDHTAELVSAGKHVLFDKPAGDDFAKFRGVIAEARRRGLMVQMGYMWRYHDGFSRIARWARSGLLGKIYAVRAHVATDIGAASAARVSAHQGGIFYDLGAHVIDQMVWILGRPRRVTSFLRRDSFDTAGFTDNALGVFEYDSALAYVDVAAMESPPPARRFEVYGDAGSAIMEPFEPADKLRLCLREPAGGHPAASPSSSSKTAHATRPPWPPSSRPSAAKPLQPAPWTTSSWSKRPSSEPATPTKPRSRASRSALTLPTGPGQCPPATPHPGPRRGATVAALREAP